MAYDDCLQSQSRVRKVLHERPDGVAVGKTKTHSPSLTIQARMQYRALWLRHASVKDEGRGCSI
jgi:hypothetical protein